MSAFSTFGESTSYISPYDYNGSPSLSVRSYSPGNGILKSPGSDASNGSDYSYNFQVASSNGIDKCKRDDTRRMKNRESAARSRERIKKRLKDLEEELGKLNDKKEAMINQKKFIRDAIDKLENNPFDTDPWTSSLKEEDGQDHIIPICQIETH